MRILIIDDETALSEGLHTGLTGEGFAVDTLEDGEEALTRILLYRDTYDLIVLDLTLPGMDGREVCLKVREEGVTTPILVLSGRGELNDRLELLSGGADDFLVKPFSFDELVARIRALLRRPQEIVSPVLTALDIELDTGQHSARRRGKDLQLTLKEFALLEYCMRNPNTVLRREDIIDNIWDFNAVSFSNVLDVHIKNLRKKLGDDGDDIIETVRGVGYRLNA